jgi:L-alanine-DL-glutamate epimerase-like enolase superfamily enzyme
MLEFSQHPSPMERLFDTGLEMRDGFVAPADRPGLGVEIDLQAARAYAV